MRFTGVVLLVCVFVAGAAFAQMESMKPAPELKKLDYFAGNWTSVGDVKPGPMGKGGKTTLHEHLEWMAGKYFLINHADIHKPAGQRHLDLISGLRSPGKGLHLRRIRQPG